MDPQKQNVPHKTGKQEIQHKQNFGNNQFVEKKKDIDAERHPEEQNIPPNDYPQKEKGDLNPRP